MNTSPKKATKILDSCYKSKTTAFLIGGTGIGKSEIVKTFAKNKAKELGLKFSQDCIAPNDSQFGYIDFRLSLMESIDLGGLPIVNDDGTQSRAFLPNLPTSGQGILFLDEFAQANMSVMAIAGQLLHEKRIGEYIMPEGWTVICAGNRASDRAGSIAIPSHAIGRVVMINVDVSTQDWLDHAQSIGVHENVLGFIGFQHHYLNNFDPKVKDAQASPRSWVRLSDLLNTDPVPEIIQDLSAGCIGEQATIEFMNFMSLKNDVPDLREIVAGKDVAIPDQGGIMYATICALISAIKQAGDSTDEWFDNAMAYINRFPSPEYGIFFVKTLSTAVPEIVNTKTYGDFKVANQDLEF